MPFRFRRTIRLLPGLRLNVSKGGMSVSAGRRGANVTVGRGQTRTTLGVPGSGISYTTTSGRRRASASGGGFGNRVLGAAVGAGLVYVVLRWLGAL